MECKMCYEKYDSLGKNPKIITACGHTFCETCLNKLTHCPKCRKLITNTIINFDILDSSHLELDEHYLTTHDHPFILKQNENSILNCNKCESNINDLIYYKCKMCDNLNYCQKCFAIFKSIEFNENGASLHNLKKFNEAIICYEKAIKLNPNYTIAYYNKGIALNELNKFNEALNSFLKSIVLNTNNADAYNGLGWALYKMKRFSESIDSYDLLISLDSLNSNAYNNKGIVLNYLERYDEALFYYNKSIQLDPNDAATYLNKGITLKNLKRNEQALFCFDKAIELNSNYLSAYEQKNALINGL